VKVTDETLAYHTLAVDEEVFLWLSPHTRYTIGPLAHALEITSV
jgi:hypothetical protein